MRTKVGADVAAAAPKLAGLSQDQVQADAEAAERAPLPQAGKLLAGQGASAKTGDAMEAVQAASGWSSECTGAAGAEAAAASDEARWPANLNVSLQNLASSSHAESAIAACAWVTGRKAHCRNASGRSKMLHFVAPSSACLTGN